VLEHGCVKGSWRVGRDSAGQGTLTFLDARLDQGSRRRAGNKGSRVSQRRRNWRHGLPTTKFRATAVGYRGAT